MTGSPPSSPLSRRRRNAVRGLIVLGSVVVLAGSFTVWVKRQALDSDRVAASTASLLQDTEVRSALASFLVDQLYAHVDVEGEIESKLPEDLSGLSGIAAGVLRDFAKRAALELLGSTSVVGQVQEAVRNAHTEFLAIVEHERGHPEVADLQLRPLVIELAKRVGLENRIEEKLPPGAGDLVLLRANSDAVVGVRKVINGLRVLSLFLTLLAALFFAGAVALAKGRRREALLGSAIGILVVSALVLVIRAVMETVLIDSLVKATQNRPAGSAVYLILTDLLATVAWTGIVFALVVLVLTLLAGPTRPARRARRLIAPAVVGYPLIGWAVLGLLVVITLVVLPIEDWTHFIARMFIVAAIVGCFELVRRVVRAENVQQSAS